MKIANVAFVTGVSTTGIGWIMYTIPILQWTALIVAIVSGIYAIRVYRKKLKDGNTGSKD